jgi:diadenosine tetraphosphate (Ap4A) HIT family hydrolase
MMNELSRTCELCTLTGGELLWQNALCRIVSVGDLDFPGFCRVILNRHAAEMSDLPSAEQQELMRVVFVVEAVVRDVLKPDKINLASLGNMVPHVHWHVIPRWREDRCFPNPIWAPAQRTSTVIPVADGPALVRQLATELASRLGEPSMTENGGQS